MFDIWLFAYLALGLLTGLLAGLFGIGGGAVMVPVLTVMFAAQGFAPDYVVHLALGTSMATIIPTSLSSLRAHHKHDAVVSRAWIGSRHFAGNVCCNLFGGNFIAASAGDLFLFFYELRGGADDSEP